MHSSSDKDESFYKDWNDKILKSNAWLQSKEKLMGQVITRINYNWFCTDEGSEYDHYEVGKNGCAAITEHRSQGEGDKWYYDAHHNDGVIVRVFNPNIVMFKEVIK